MDTQRYLQHIGFTGAARPDLPTLQQLHHRHMLSVPFENLSIIYHQGIWLAPEALFSKVVERNRGGFCYELNTLFALLLREIGFRVSFISGEIRARVGHFGPPYDHLALRVDLEDQAWLVDVGFGDSFLTPLKIVVAEPQPQASGTFHPNRKASITCWSAATATNARMPKPCIALRFNRASCMSSTRCAASTAPRRSRISPSARCVHGQRTTAG